MSTADDPCAYAKLSTKHFEVMFKKEILLGTNLMDAYLEPDMVGEQMGQPIFSIQAVDYATDVIAIRQTGTTHIYAAT